MSDNYIAKSWLSYYKTGDKKFLWATEYLLELTQENPKRSWIIIILIINLIESMTDNSWKDFIISNLAAGPMEELLSNYGEIIIPLLEEGCKKNNELIKLLNMCYKHNMNNIIWGKIKSLTNKHNL